MPIVLFILFSMTTCSLFPAHLTRALEEAEASHKVFNAKNKLINAEHALLLAQGRERPEDEIKKRQQAVEEAAQGMLFLLATLDDKYVRKSDIDFCLKREPALDDVLAIAACFGGITLMRELISRGADVGINDNAALCVAIIEKRDAIKELLLEAGNRIIE